MELFGVFLFCFSVYFLDYILENVRFGPPCTGDEEGGVSGQTITAIICICVYQ